MFIQRLEEIPAFRLSKTGEGPPQKLRWSKQRIGLRQKRFEEPLQKYTCERSVKFDFSMDISQSIGVES